MRKVAAAAGVLLHHGHAAIRGTGAWCRALR
jgi:hypothetical protein